MRLGLKIAKIIRTELDGFRVTLKFKSGEVGTVSLIQYFSNPQNLAIEVLRGGMFAKCFVESGGLAWPNGLEFCPDALYMMMKSQARSKGKKVA